MTRIHHFITLSFTLAVLALLIPSRSEADLGFTVNLHEERQAIDGFGASSAWTSSALSEEESDLFFSPTTGLGLSLLRVRIAPDGTTGEMTTALRAAARGVKVWATPWSPPAEWKTNNDVNNGGQLLPQHHQDWADRLADFAFAMEAAGVPLVALSAQNEPNYVASWETCEWTAAELTAFIRDYLGPALVARGVSTRVLAPEVINWNTIANYADTLLADSAARSYLSHIGTHAYGGSPFAYTTPAQHGLPFWQTEYSDNVVPVDPGIDSAMRVANDIHDFLTISEGNAWHFWWLRPRSELPDSTGALLGSDGMTKRGWALGNWARFVRPGDRRVLSHGSTETVRASAFVSSDNRRFTMVAINSDTVDRSVPVAIEGLAEDLTLTLTPWETSAIHSLEPLPPVASSSDGSFLLELPARSVTTFVGSLATDPDAPTHLTAKIINSSEVALLWSSAEEAVAYNVKRSLNPDGPYTTIASNLTQTGYTDTSANNGLTYYYAISSISETEEGPDSDPASVKVVKLLLPEADAFVRDGGSANTNFGSASSLEVKLDAEGFNRETFLRFPMGGLADVESAVLRLMPVASSTNLPGTGFNIERLTNHTWSESGITWNNRPTSTGTVLGTRTGFVLGEPVRIDVSSSARVDAAAHGTFSVAIRSFIQGFDRFVAFGSRENQTPENRPVLEYLLPGPPAPGGLNATPVDDHVVLDWSAAPGTTSYLVKRATTSGGPYTIVASGITSTSYTDASVTGSKRYFYVVSALSAENESAHSNEASLPPGFERLAHLRFDEQSGATAIDSSGNGWHANLVNGPAWSQGKVNGAVLLDGTNDHLTLPSGVVNSLNDFTVSLWVNLNTVSTWSRIFDFGTDTNNFMVLTPQNGNTGVVRFMIRIPDTPSQIIDGATALSANEWTHLAVTLSGSTGRLYVNGQLAGSNPGMTLTPANLGVTTSNYLGRSQWANDPYLNGRLDEFQIFTRALEPLEIAELAEPPSAPTGFTATATPFVTLQWDHVPGASSYNIKRTSVDEAYLTIASGIVENHYVDLTATAGTQYYYVVTASRGGAESSDSDSESVTATFAFEPPLLEIIGGEVRLTVPESAPHATHQLQYSDNLASGTWTNYGEAQAGDGDELVLTMPFDPEVLKRFYRVMIE